MMKKMQLTVIVLLFLVTFVNSLTVRQSHEQRGGGGFRGGGSFRGGSWARSWGRRGYQGGGWAGLGIFVGSLAAVFSVCYCCYNPHCCRSKKSNIMARVLGNFIRRQPDQLNQSLMRQICSDLNSMLAETTQGRRRFIYSQEGIQHQVMIKEAALTFDSMRGHLTMKGEDELGSWESEGYVMLGQLNVPFFWMVKFYDNPSVAGQTGQFEVLIYESTVMRPDYYQGRWYYEGMENDRQYSGGWKLA